MQTGFVRHVRQRPHVFGKAAPAITQPGIQERTPDALIVTHAGRYLFDVRSQAFTNLRNFINEGYFGCQECVGGILNHFGCVQVRDNHGGAQRQIERGNFAGRFLVS